MKESWFPIKRYKGKYEVSDQGNIRHAATRNPVHERRNTTGERQALLYPTDGAKHWAPVRDIVASELLGEACVTGRVIHADGDPV